MIALALTLAFGAGTADTLRADSVRSLTTPPWWEMSSSSNAESFTSRLPMWQWHSLALRRRTKSATHAVEAFAARRAGVWNSGIALEETRAMGARGYLVARGQVAPRAHVIPRYDLALDGYKGFGAGWELAVATRLMLFEDTRVPVVALGLGRYVGAWYLRGRVSRAHMDGASGMTSQASARRYIGDSATDFVEGGYAIGHEVTPLTPTVVDLRRTTDGVLRGQKSLGRATGASFTLTYSTNESLPDRRGATLGAFVRW